MLTRDEVRWAGACLRCGAVLASKAEDEAQALQEFRADHDPTHADALRVTRIPPKG